MSNSRRWLLAFAVIFTPPCPDAHGADPARDLHDYVLFAERGLRTRELLVRRGDVGVNRGAIEAKGKIVAPGSRLIADTVRLDDRSICAELLVSSTVERAAPACGPGTPFVPPIVASLREACGVPDEPPPCDGTAPVTVPAGETMPLAPGTYGDVDVRGAASRHGVLTLGGGSYVFCSLRTHRGAIVRASGATRVFVDGDVRIGSASSVGIGTGLDPTALDIRSTGLVAFAARNAAVTATFCAPDADLHVGDAVVLNGSFAAGQIVAGRATVNGLPPGEASTTSTTVTTTSTSTSTTTRTTSSTTSSTATTTTVTASTLPSTITSTTVPSTTTTTTTTGTGTTSTTTSTTTPVPTTSSSTSTTTTVTTSTVTTTTSSTTTSSSSTTTLPQQVTCPAGGQVDAVTTLVPNAQTYSSNVVEGIEVDLGYPATVSMPGTGFLPVNDPADPTTLVALLSADPNGIDLYDGLPTFYDADTATPATLRTILALNPTANLIFSQPVPFERARFTCTPGTVVPASGFTCAVSSEVDLLARQIPPEQRPPCTITLASP